MTTYHPQDELILSHATGRLASAPALVVATHLEMCPRCRERSGMVEQLGGALLEECEPVPLQTGALERTLQAIQAAGRLPASTSSVGSRHHPPMPAGVPWPNSLKDCHASSWHWLAPGMRWSRVTLPWDTSANVVLLRIAAGKNLAWHTHTERELTLVLHGHFSDGRTRLGPGDFDETDRSVHHQPVVESGSECICLASIEGHVLFDNWLARRLGAVIGM